MSDIFISSVDETVSNLVNGTAHHYLLSKEISGMMDDQVLALMYLKRMFPNDLVFECKTNHTSAFADENSEGYFSGFWRVENSTCMDLLALIEVHPIWRAQTTFVLSRLRREMDEKSAARKADAAVKRMLKKIELSADKAVFNKLDPVLVQKDFIFDTVSLSTSELETMLLLLREILKDTDIFQSESQLDEIMLYCRVQKRFILGCSRGYGFLSPDAEGRENRAVVAGSGNALKLTEDGNLYRLYRNESNYQKISKRELISEPLTQGKRTEFHWY